MTRPHGYARYRLDKCRCSTCKAATAAYWRRTAMAKTAGTWHPFVDAQPVRDHVTALAAAGIGQRRLAEIAGITRSRLQALMVGHNGRPPSKKVRPALAAAILAVQPGLDKLAEHQLVDGTGTARRIKALVAIGWTITDQAGRAGSTVSNYGRLVHGGRVLASTARLIAGIYDELSMTPAPDGPGARRARARAAARDWAPPLAWDDEQIDKPEAKPSGWIGQPQRESLADFAARYQPIADQGLRWAEIADRLGITVYAAKGKARRAREAGLLGDVAAEQVAA